MSLARTVKRRDANQGEIVAALKRIGAEVWILDRPCDLAVWWGSKWFMLESKTRRGKLTPRQKADREVGRCAGISIVRDAGEALSAIGAIRESGVDCEAVFRELRAALR